MLGLTFFRIQRRREPKLLTLYNRVPHWAQNQSLHILNPGPSYLNVSLKEILASGFQKEKLHNFWEIVPLTQRNPFSPQNPPPAPPVEHIPHLGLSGGAPVRRATMSIDAPMCLDNWEARGCSECIPHRGELRVLTCFHNTHSFQGGPMTPAPTTHPSGTNICVHGQAKALTQEENIY